MNIIKYFVLSVVILIGCTSFDLRANEHFISACRKNKITKVKKMLDDGIDPNYLDDENWTALYFGSFHRHYDIVKILLEYGADPNIQNEVGRAPLHVAVSNGYRGDLSIVKLLLKKEADPNVLDQWNQTPLLLTGHSNPEIIKKLLKYKADPNIQNIDGDTPLYIACKWGAIESVKMLISYNALPNLICEYGNTALHRAVLSKHPEIVKLLLECEADPSIKNKAGYTPLDLAQRELKKYVDETEYPDLRERCIDTVELLSKDIHY